MKRLVLIILGLTVCGLLLAQASPFSFYGSARSGFFYNMVTFEEDSQQSAADPTETVDGRLMLMDESYFQPNSRIGFNYQKDNVTGKFELGGNGSVRLLWGKYDFDGFSLLAGQDYDGTNMLSNQTFYNDLGLLGYGAIDGGRNPQIKFGFMDESLYLALIKPNVAYDPTASVAEIDAIIPKINLGWKGDLNDDMKLHITALFQMYSYTEDFTGFDGSVMSYLLGLTYDATFSEKMRLRVHGNFGSNVANMGLVGGGKESAATWNAADEETVDVTSMGGYLTFNMDMTDQFGFGIGVGYASTAITDDKDVNDEDFADDRMAFYLQLPYKTLGSLTITPEVGMHMEMKNKADKDAGSNLYFGAQLKYDF